MRSVPRVWLRRSWRLAVVFLALGCAQSRDLTPSDHATRDAGSKRTDASDASGDGGESGDSGDSGDSGEGDAQTAQPADGVLAEPDDAAAFLFDQSELRTYELEITPEDLARIDADPRAEEYVPAVFTFEGETRDVLVRYKGSIGGFRGCVGNGGFAAMGPKACTKLSMKVGFDRMDPDGRFHGLRKLQFHAMVRDPSMLRERLGYALFRQMGLPAPRAVHARLVINGQLSGLYALVEQIDGRFTRSRFEEGGRGNLYKEAWPIDSARIASTEEYLRQHLKTNEDQDPTFEGMREFGQALEAASASELPDVLERYMDADSLMRYVAADRTLAHDDGPFHFYCTAGCSNHNYYLYEEASHERVWLIAWDFDSIFNLDNPITTLNFAWDDPSIGCQAQVIPPAMLPITSPLCDKLWLGASHLQQRYLDAVRELLDGPLQADRVERQLSEWEVQIEPVVLEAAELHSDAASLVDWQQAREGLRLAVGMLRSRAEGRLERGVSEIRDPF